MLVILLLYRSSFVLRYRSCLVLRYHSMSPKLAFDISAFKPSKYEDYKKKDLLDALKSKNPKTDLNFRSPTEDIAKMLHKCLLKEKRAEKSKKSKGESSPKKEKEKSPKKKKEEKKEKSPKKEKEEKKEKSPKKEKEEKKEKSPKKKKEEKKETKIVNGVEKATKSKKSNRTTEQREEKKKNKKTNKYVSQNLADLKKLCKERKLKVGGKKEELVQRLLESDGDEGDQQSESEDEQSEDENENEEKEDEKEQDKKENEYMDIEIITSYKIPELKHFCSQRNLKVGGKKEELIYRLRDYNERKNNESLGEKAKEEDDCEDEGEYYEEDLDISPEEEYDLIVEDYTIKSLKELKQICKDRGLKMCGKKEDIIDRLDNSL